MQSGDIDLANTLQKELNQIKSKQILSATKQVFLMIKTKTNKVGGKYSRLH